MSHPEEQLNHPADPTIASDLDAALHSLREGEMDERQQAQLQAIVEQEEKSTRQLPPVWTWVVSTLGIGMSGFYIYTAGTLPAPVQWQRGLYVLLTFVLIFLLYPTIPGKTRLGRYLRHHPTKKQQAVGGLQRGARLVLGNGRLPGLLDLILIALTLWVVGYYIAEFEALQKRAGAYNEMDFLIGAVGLVLSLEVSRRVLGWSMTIIGLVFVLYLRYGYVLYDWPVLEAFAHRGRAFDRVATILYFDQEGVFGVMANVLVTYVILFIFFGAFLRKSGASRFFIDLPLALAGRTVGGPAKVSVIASALFGSISGSAIANTVSTGAFTIPLMKRAGFKPHVAGAIEPAASIGGMFMPPVMGAGAFLMAELTSIPYRTIVLISIFPAILYFLSVLTMVHFEAKKLNLQGLESDVKVRDILVREWYMALPLLVIVALMMAGYSPGFAAFWSIISCIVLMLFKPNAGAGHANSLVGRIRSVFNQSVEALVEGARDTLVIGATVGVIGIIVGTIYATGIGLRFSDIIISLSNGNVLVAIVLIGLASLVLGMGVPVTAAYLIVAVLAVPALTDLGVALIAAHMIVYWFSQDSNITPPVCVAAYAGAAIAGSDPWKTGWTAFKFAKLLYVMPLLFAYSPAILLVGEGGQILQDLLLHDVILAYISGFLGTIAFSAITMGYLVRRTTVLEWIVAALGAFLCFFPNLPTDLAGIAIIAAVWFWRRYDVKRRSAVQMAKA